MRLYLVRNHRALVGKNTNGDLCLVANDSSISQPIKKICYLREIFMVPVRQVENYCISTFVTPPLSLV